MYILWFYDNINNSLIDLYFDNCVVALNTNICSKKCLFKK